MWGIIGLGNPGARYERTRHNVGFAVVELLAQRFRVRLRAGAQALWALASYDGERLLLVKPMTYVNRSGVALQGLLEAHPRLHRETLLVVVDDVALPFGKLRLRAEGSAGGHNGLLSIEEVLESRAYARLRIGVGAQQPGEDLADHVLGRFHADEAEALPAILNRSADAVESVLRVGIEATIPLVNATSG